VVRLLEVHVEAQGIAVGADATVELRKSHAEPLGLVRLRGGEKPEHRRVQAGFRARAGYVAQVGRPVHASAGAHRLARQPCEELVAPGEAVAVEVGLTVAGEDERQEGVTVRHGRLRRSTTPISSASARAGRSRSPRARVPAGPTPIEREGMPLPTRAANGVAREFVQAHGGTLEVDGGPGRGATFMMRLPLAPPGEAAFVRRREAG